MSAEEQHVLIPAVVFIRAGDSDLWRDIMSVCDRNREFGSVLLFQCCQETGVSLCECVCVCVSSCPYLGFPVPVLV